MKKINQKIKSDIKLRNMTQVQVAEKMDMSYKMLNYWLKGNKEMPLDMYLNLLNAVYSEVTDEKITEYAKHINSTLRIQELFEWCWQNSKTEIADHIFGKLQGVKSWEKYLEIQTLIFKRNNGLSKEEFYQKIDGIELIKGDMIETKLIYHLAMLYFEYDNLALGLLQYRVNKIFNILDKINSSYIKKSIGIKVQHIMLVWLFKTSQTDKFVESLKLIEDEFTPQEFPRVMKYLFYTCAEFYMFTNPQKSRSYIEKSMRIKVKSTDYANTEMKKTLDFINIYTGNYEALYLEDARETAYYLIKTGRREEGVKLLKEMDKLDSPFSLYYLGLGTGELSYYFKSIERFSQQGNYHYMQLPLNEIRKLS